MCEKTVCAVVVASLCRSLVSDYSTIFDVLS